MGSRMKTKNNIYGDIYDHFQVSVANVIYEMLLLENFAYLHVTERVCVRVQNRHKIYGKA